MGLDQGERGHSGVSVGFVLLAHGAALDVLPHELCETQSPELGSYELTCFEITGMSGGLMIMAAGKDGTTEGVLQGNINVILVGQDVVIELPI